MYPEAILAEKPHTRAKKPIRNTSPLTVFPVIVLLLMIGGGCGKEDKHPGRGTATIAEMMLVRDPVVVVTKDGKTNTADSNLRLTEGDRIISKGGRAFVTHDEGGRILLSADAEVEVGSQGLLVINGKVWIEAREGIRTEYRVGDLKLSSTGAGFELIKKGEAIHLYVVRGAVYYERGDDRGEAVEGLEAKITAAEINISPKDLWDDWTGGLAWPSAGTSTEIPGLGEIGARRPGSLGQARFPLVIRRMEVRTLVRGDLAVTRVVQEFFNPVSEALEGLYKLSLPQGALLQSFGIDRNGEIVHGYIKEKEQATAQYRSQVYEGSRDDPALLTWEAPGRYTAHIYPIPAGSTRKVEVVYTEWLHRKGSRRYWRYPLSPGTGRSVRIGELDIIADFSGADADNLQSSLGARIHKGVLSLNRSDYMPRADLVCTLHGNKPGPRTVTGYRVAGEKEGDFFLARIYPEEIRARKEPERIDLIIVVDMSAGTDPTRLHLAGTMAEALMRHLTPEDRVAVLGGDLELRGVKSEEIGLLQATRENREGFMEALARTGVGGATDLGNMLNQAARLVETENRASVVYIGDGFPTVGEMNLPDLQNRLHRLEHPLRLYGVGVGGEANLDLLSGLAGESGLAVRIEGRAEAGSAALEIMSHMNRNVLRNVEIDAGPSVERVYPGGRVDIVEGEPIVVVGRIRRNAPKRIQLKGLRGSRPFEQSFVVTDEKLEDFGDVRLRWAENRLKQLLSQGAGREEMVELGTRFGLITPYTSFYVPSARELLQNEEEARRARLAAREARDRFAKLEISLRDMEKTAAEAPMERAAQDRSEISVEESADEEVESEPLSETKSAPSPAAQPLQAPSSDPLDGLSSTPPRPSRTRARTSSVTPQPESDQFEGRLGAVSTRGATRTTAAERRRRERAQRDVAPRGGEAPGARGGLDGDDSSPAAPPITTGESLALTSRPPAPDRISRGVDVDVKITIDIKDRRPRRCSPASEKPLSVRRNLWRERLRAHGGFPRVLEVWQDAAQFCELKTWADSRTLLSLMLNRLGSVNNMLMLYRHFRRHPGIEQFLRRSIIGRVTGPEDLRLVMNAIGMGRDAKWTVIQDMLDKLDSPELRLQTIRKFLAIHPGDARLKSMLLDLLEKLGRHEEAMTLVEEVKGDPYADAGFRTAAAEYLLRRDENNKPVAMRILSEMVEFRPHDPAVRRRLGDLYRAYGWHDEAYRQYETLANLRPQDMSVLLLMAAAAADGGRIDEALRLEGRVAGSAEPGTAQGLARWALLWKSVRLMKLRWNARQENDTETLATLLARTRRSGVLSSARPLRIALIWSHPSADVELSVGAGKYRPSRANLLGSLFGIEAFETGEISEDGYTIQVSRVGPESQRRVNAQLLVMWNEGKPDEKLWIKDLSFGPDDREAKFKLEDGQVREVQ